MNEEKTLHVITIMIIFFGILVSAAGLFYTTGGQPFEMVNQYGDIVKIYGDGIYAYDSYFYAPIFRGADLTILFVAVPALIVALIMDMRKKSLKSRLFLVSVISIFAYHAASISFCVVYNVLHLAYIILFSLTFFALATAIISIINNYKINKKEKVSYRGIYIFLGFTGIALFLAWMPDIISSIIKGRPPVSLEIYTTSVTNVLDIGFISPTALLTIHLLKKESKFGFALAPMLITLCFYIGIMIVSQTIFQANVGIVLTLPVMITKTGSFVLLAIFALYFDVKFFKSL